MCASKQVASIRGSEQEWGKLNLKIINNDKCIYMIFGAGGGYCVMYRKKYKPSAKDNTAQRNGNVGQES